MEKRKLRLEMTAANLLMEEYPLSERELVKEPNGIWLLDTKVCSFVGICRFYVGLMNDVEIVYLSEFEEFVKKYISNFRF